MNEAATANILVMAKGFRVSEPTEEFQRVIPRATDELSAIESRVAGFKHWPSILEDLYRLNSSALLSERMILTTADQVAVVSVALSEDKYNRPSPIVVCASAPISWYGEAAELTAAKCSSLTVRLAAIYARLFAGAPERVREQLRDGSFITERSYSLADEYVDEDVESIIAAVRKWKGVTGVSTAILAPLGANIIWGTRHEAALAATDLQHPIAGYFDVRLRGIVALTSAITPWVPTIADVGSPPRGEELANRIERIEERLEAMDGILHRIAAGVSQLLGAALGTRRQR